MKRSRQHYLGLRKVTVDDQLPGREIRLKKGEQVFISISDRGRDRRYRLRSIDSDQFYPERFLIADQHCDDQRAASIPFDGVHRKRFGSI